MPFTETQTHSLLFLLLAPCALLSVIFMFWRYGNWNVFKRSIGNRGSLEGTPLDRMNKKLLFAICLSPFAFIMLYFMLTKLDTRIDEAGIHYRLFPAQWHENVIPWSDIYKTELRDVIIYPRYVTTYETYAVSDKYGLYLFLTDGRRLIIGTKKPDEIEQAIAQYRWQR